MTSDRVDELMEAWQRERPDLDHTVMASLGRIFHVAAAIDARFEAQARRYDLTRADVDVLFTLRRAGPPYRMLPSRMADSLMIASGTMTARLDRLEQRGLVERRPNPEDRRSVEVGLTDRGFRLTEAGISAHVEHEERILAALSQRERAALDRALRKLLAHVSALD